MPITALGNVTLSTIAWVNTSLGASSMIEGARAVRLSVQIHTSKEETAKQAAFQTSIGYYFIPFYRFGKSQVFYGNSWASMKGHEVDWSGVRRDGAESMNSHRMITPRWIWPIINANGAVQRYSSIMNSDREGAFWITLHLSRSHWAAIELSLAGEAINIEALKRLFFHSLVALFRQSFAFRNLSCYPKTSGLRIRHRYCSVFAQMAAQAAFTYRPELKWAKRLQKRTFSGRKTLIFMRLGTDFRMVLESFVSLSALVLKVAGLSDQTNPEW